MLIRLSPSLSSSKSFPHRLHFLLITMFFLCSHGPGLQFVQLLPVVLHLLIIFLLFFCRAFFDLSHEFPAIWFMEARQEHPATTCTDHSRAFVRARMAPAYIYRYIFLHFFLFTFLYLLQFLSGRHPLEWPTLSR